MKNVEVLRIDLIFFLSVFNIFKLFIDGITVIIAVIFKWIVIYVDKGRRYAIFVPSRNINLCLNYLNDIPLLLNS